MLRDAQHATSVESDMHAPNARRLATSFVGTLDRFGGGGFEAVAVRLSACTVHGCRSVGPSCAWSSSPPGGSPGLALYGHVPLSGLSCEVAVRDSHDVAIFRQGTVLAAELAKFVPSVRRYARRVASVDLDSLAPRLECFVDEARIASDLGGAPATGEHQSTGVTRDSINLGASTFGICTPS